MRYYSIQIGDTTYTSLAADGTTNPGALNVELNIEQTAHDQPGDGAFVRIWGIGLAAISQANQLVGKDITVMGGMSAPGLPLANPSQQGVLVKGMVFRAFGNWIGVDQTLDIIITVTSSTPTVAGPNPKPVEQNIIMNWKKDQPMGDAIKQALQTAFPAFTPMIEVSDKLIAPSDQIGFVGNIKQFADYCRRYSQMLNPQSPGVSINFFNGVANVFDETRQSQAGIINFYDLIGQPTWIGYNEMQIKCVMRGDMGGNFGKQITLPQTLVTNTAAGGLNVAGSTSPQQSLSFQGTFTLKKIRHVGNFRQPDAASWVTILDAYSESSSGG